MKITTKQVASLCEQHPASAIMNCEQVDAMAQLIANQSKALGVMREALLLYQGADIAFQHGDDTGQAKLYTEACAANTLAIKLANEVMGDE